MVRSPESLNSFLFFVLFVLLGLTGCIEGKPIGSVGGTGNNGGGGSPTSAPAAPVVSVVYDVNQIILVWSTVGGADYYRVRKNPDAVSGYSQISGDITATNYVDVVPVHLVRWGNLSYIVQACNTVGCTDSLAVNNATTVSAQLIGYGKPSDPTENGQFGGVVALSADGATLAIGSVSASPLGGGAVYVFTHDGIRWTEQAKLTDSNTNPFDRFGSAVALSGDGKVLAIGAPGDSSDATGVDSSNINNNNAPSSGAVYIFRRDIDGTWIQKNYIKASNTGTSDHFGNAVSLSADGNLLAIGADGEGSAAIGVNESTIGYENNNAIASGAVYLFRSSGTTWSEQAFVKASNTEAGDWFGYALALSDDGNTLAVGAILEDSSARGVEADQDLNNGEASGAVYVFSQDDAGVWSQQTYIKASNAEVDDEFGYSLALSTDGNTLSVGAIGEDSSSIGVNPGTENNLKNGSGAAYVFKRGGSAWGEQAYVKALNSGTGDSFGGSMALSDDGNILAIGAINEDSAGVGINGLNDDTSESTDRGAVYVLTRTNNTEWGQLSYVKSSNGIGATTKDDNFGVSVALSNDGSTLAVGAMGDDSKYTGISNTPPNVSEDGGAENSGAVYLY